MPSLTAPPTAADSNDFYSRAEAFQVSLTAFNAASSLEATDIQQVQLGNAFYGAVLPLHSSTSNTTNTVGYGDLTFTVDLFKLFPSGMRIRAVSGTNWVSGEVLSYNSNTGALLVRVLAFLGSGTSSSWVVKPEFRRVQGALYTVASAASVNLLYASDRALDLTGSTTITSFTMATGQVTYLIAKGAITIVNNAGILNLPGSLNYTTAIDDILELHEASGVIRVTVHPKTVVYPKRNKMGVFGFGYTGSYLNMLNFVSDVGTVISEVASIASIRFRVAAAGYGGDKAIFGYGHNGSVAISLTNTVSAAGVISGDVSGVGTARSNPASATYGGDKAIFGYGSTGVSVSMTNLVSSVGVVSADTTGIGTARDSLGAASYGGDKAIFGFGWIYPGSISTGLTNLVSNLGVVATDTAAIGYPRYYPSAASYGGDKAIFIFGHAAGGNPLTYANLISNLGVVASNTSGTGTARSALAATTYGHDKVMCGYGLGTGGSYLSMTNLVSNTGVIATDTTGVGTARAYLGAAGFSQ